MKSKLIAYPVATLLLAASIFASAAVMVPSIAGAATCTPGCKATQQCVAGAGGTGVCQNYVCTPACTGGKSCTGPNKCTDLTGGGTTVVDPANGGGTTVVDPNAAPSGPTSLENPLNGIDSLDDLLMAILKAVVYIGTIILTLALVYVGFLFVAAQGSEEKLRNARAALMWTIIGGLVLLGATAIGEVLKATVANL